jgi:hypothetical protein
LVFLWRLLKHERPFLKKIQQEGIKLVCHCKVGKGPAVVQPNASEMLHLLGAELVLEVR